MGKLYKVVFVYPDGHLEETFDTFNDAHDALNYGNSLLAQVRGTGDIRDASLDNPFGRKKHKAYFMIVEISKDKSYSIVYDSRD